jgi:hypothetical protein
MVAVMVAAGQLRVGRAGRCHQGMCGCRREVYCMGIWYTGRCDVCRRSQKVQVRSLRCCAEVSMIVRTMELQATT